MLWNLLSRCKKGLLIYAAKFFLQQESNQFNLQVEDLHTILELTRLLQIFSISYGKINF
jgi:hypothetical protein